MQVTGARCLRCERPADGRLRAAYWEEEERGRLGAHSAPLCPECHADFLVGKLDRVRVAELAHARRGYRPAEWIARIDRDTLLDIACLQCGALLPREAAAGQSVVCSRCDAENRFAERVTPVGVQSCTASLGTDYRENRDDA